MGSRLAYILAEILGHCIQQTGEVVTPLKITIQRERAGTIMTTIRAWDLSEKSLLAARTKRKRYVRGAKERLAADASAKTWLRC